MGRSPCCDKNDVKKGPWTAEEDNKLTQYIQIHGPGNWRTLPKNAGLQRCGKSCRLRWTNYLKPDIKRGRFTFEEEETIIQLHSVLGNKWSAIAARLPGRTDNEIKNYWNTHIRKRLLRKGIDPITHAPRLDILDLSSLLNSPQFNISNLFLLQTLLNPEALRLALNLLSSQNQNPDILLKESQLLNSNNQFQSQAEPNQFDNIINQQTPSSNITTAFENQTQFMQGNMEQFLMNPTNSDCQIFQDNLLPNANIRQNFCYGDLSDDSSFKSLNSSCSNSNSQNFSFYSVLSTPLSSPNNLDSASGLFNGGTEDEIESFCSNLLKIEIPEGIDFDDFM